MQELFGSVRRSLAFRNSTAENDVGFGNFIDKIGSSIRRSGIGLPFSKTPPFRALPPSPAKENMPPQEAPQIRWRRGELIGCGAFGRVYMGMNLDSGELLAVKQVLIAANGASKEKAQAHIRELEEEVKLLKNLSHENIVRYLGTAREEDALNILLEFVPGGSIASLLGKFGSFPESVIRTYTKQLLRGLEYLHRNGIMHRDIKGANILVDNRGCIKLADFGASKKVVELATMTGAKSMKGTPYWMAPEVILQTGHTFSADIWSVGCTVIEMATGKPPWCQYQEVAALFHIGTTKSPPPIPDHLSDEAKDFLHKCLKTEPHLRASAVELLEHPFVTGEYRASQTGFRRSVMENSGIQSVTPPMNQKSIRSNVGRTTSGGLKDICNIGSVGCSTVYPENYSGSSPLWGTNTSDDDMCLIDDQDDFTVDAPEHSSPAMAADDLTKSFNPMSEPDDWPCKFDDAPEVGSSNVFSTVNHGTPEASCNVDAEFSFPSEQLADDDDEVTESKIKAFLDEKALDLKKLQDEFYNTINTAKVFETVNGDDVLSDLPSKSPRPASNRRLSSASNRRLSSAVDVAKTASPVSQAKQAPENGASSSPSFSERQRIWKEELDKELEMERERLAERLRQAGGKTSSPNKRFSCHQKDRLPFASPPK